jgi:hypothetical protein
MRSPRCLGPQHGSPEFEPAIWFFAHKTSGLVPLCDFCKKTLWGGHDSDFFSIKEKIDIYCAQEAARFEFWRKHARKEFVLKTMRT